MSEAETVKAKDAFRKTEFAHHCTTPDIILDPIGLSPIMPTAVWFSALPTAKSGPLGACHGLTNLHLPRSWPAHSCYSSLCLWRWHIGVCITLLVSATLLLAYGDFVGRYRSSRCLVCSLSLLGLFRSLFLGLFRSTFPSCLFDISIAHDRRRPKYHGIVRPANFSFVVDLSQESFLFSEKTLLGQGERISIGELLYVFL